MSKKPIVVAGRSYNSVEEMPAEVRRVYDLAVAARNEGEDHDRLKIVFNGQEYESLDKMPPDVRKLYQTQQVAMETYRDFSVDSTTPRAGKVNAPPQKRMEPAESSFFKRHKWLLIAAAVVLVLLLVLAIR
ncbi:MAG TPA: hypothetical protein VFV77_00310 [Gammaproteobacteria bacterium]|nr:hypothetical protein [Gammaproteobacteria bacterium]